MADLPEPLWRLGYHGDPLGFKPRDLYAWTNRFDDERREYRTLYAATDRATCVFELAQDLRPNTAAIAEFHEVFPGVELPPASLPRDWYSKLVFAAATLVQTGPLCDLRDPDARNRIERDHAELLAEQGITHLDLTSITSTNRVFTQALSRRLWDEGFSGLVFTSNVGPGACICVFETRAELDPADEPEPLTRETPELQQVCAAWSLELGH